MKILKSRDKKAIDQIKKNALIALSIDSVWIYTLMKSGTTYSLLFLSNYLNSLYGDGSKVSYDQMQNDFFFHSSERRLKSKDLGLLIENRKKISTEIPSIIHTHEFIEHHLWNKNISLYRNPLDYLISFYFYFYKKRGKYVSHPRKIIEKRLPKFINVYNHQKQLKEKYPDTTLWLSYEKLMNDPYNAFSEMIRFLGLKYDEELIHKAMEFSSKKSVQQMEEERGGALVVSRRKKFSGSFVRSGKIGEWKEYFNDEDLNKIESILNESNLSLRQFTIE